MKLNENVRSDIVRTLQGIEFIPNVKKQIVGELKKYIADDKVNSLVGNHDINSANLTTEETLSLLKVIYNFTKDNKFNPVNFLEDKQVPKGEKDKDSSLYYNFEFKQKFVEKNYKETTQRVVNALFRKTAKLETAYGKDVYDFSVEELTELFKSLKAKTLRSLQNSISTIEQYIDFAIKNKVTQVKLNYAITFDNKDRIENLLDTEAMENMIFDKDEIMEMAMNSDNAQDGVILGLLFDGVSHKNEFEELTNLTEDDVDFENQEVKVSDRNVPISTETMILIKDALKQEKYVSINGEKSRKYKIAEGKNIIRGLRGKVKVKGQIISQRILRIAEIFDYEFLNATTVSYSGQLQLAKELLDNNVSLEETIDTVLNRFGIPVNTSSQFYLRNRIEKYLNIK
jgi:integrase